jgi:hypothetical protein
MKSTEIYSVNVTAFGLGGLRRAMPTESVFRLGFGAAEPEIRRFTQQDYKPNVMMAVPAATATICLPGGEHTAGGVSLHRKAPFDVAVPLNRRQAPSTNGAGFL